MSHLPQRNPIVLPIPFKIYNFHKSFINAHFFYFIYLFFIFYLKYSKHTTTVNRYKQIPFKCDLCNRVNNIIHIHIITCCRKSNVYLLNDLGGQQTHF